MNKPVNFEIAKLLKEKGFDIITTKYYRATNPLVTEEDLSIQLLDNSQNIDINHLSYIYKPAPIIAEVVMWLYEKHGIWISVKTIKWNYEHNTIRFNYNIVKFNDKNSSDIINVVYNFNSPTEAYLAAIEYTLNELI